jgi:hypothetical protein
MGSIQDRIMVVTDLLLGAVRRRQALRSSRVRKPRRAARRQAAAGRRGQTDQVSGREFDLNKTTADFGKDPPMKRKLPSWSPPSVTRTTIDMPEDEYMQKPPRRSA